MDDAQAVRMAFWILGFITGLLFTIATWPDGGFGDD